MIKYLRLNGDREARLVFSLQYSVFRLQSAVRIKDSDRIENLDRNGV